MSERVAAVTNAELEDFLGVTIESEGVELYWDNILSEWVFFVVDAE